MQKSGFFNALRTEEGYDRQYNANDYSENLAVVIGSGVLRSANDDLKVTASGLTVSVNVGRAWIEGHWYKNDSIYSFDAVPAPIGGKRYDRVMLRLDKSLATREIKLVYVFGVESANPVRPEPIRDDVIYDLVLADIYLNTNTTAVTVTDRREDDDVCGWVYSTSGDNSFFKSLDNSFYEWFHDAKDTLSSVTLFKKYTQKQTLTEDRQAVAFYFPQYDSQTCFAEIYVNGIYDERHTVSPQGIVTFQGTLVAGTVVTMNVYKSIDGTGIMDVADEITELQNQYATLNGISKFTYKCTGLNDNISLSQIANALLTGSYTVGTLSEAAEAFLAAIGGNAYLSTLSADAHLTVTVSGTLGASTPFSGTGAVDNRYKWFSLGLNDGQARKVIFDFAKCPKIDITCSANTHNLIFFGNDLTIRNANVLGHSSGANCHITMASGRNAWGVLNFTQCNFNIITTGKAVICDSGNFTDCNLHTKSSGENSFCIDAKDEGLARINGCTLFAYTGTSSKIASVFNVESNQTGAVIMAVNVNCPTVAQTGYQQQYLVRSNNGMTLVNGVCSTMTSIGNASYRNIIGQIWKSKH